MPKILSGLAALVLALSTSSLVSAEEKQECTPTVENNLKSLLNASYSGAIVIGINSKECSTSLSDIKQEMEKDKRVALLFKPKSPYNVPRVRMFNLEGTADNYQLAPLDNSSKIPLKDISSLCLPYIDRGNGSYQGVRTEIIFLTCNKPIPYLENPCGHNQDDVIIPLTIKPEERSTKEGYTGGFDKTTKCEASDACIIGRKLINSRPLSSPYSFDLNIASIAQATSCNLEVYQSQIKVENQGK